MHSVQLLTAGLGWMSMGTSLAPAAAEAAALLGRSRSRRAIRSYVHACMGSQAGRQAQRVGAVAQAKRGPAFWRLCGQSNLSNLDLRGRPSFPQSADARRHARHSPEAP